MPLVLFKDILACLVGLLGLLRFFLSDHSRDGATPGSVLKDLIRRATSVRHVRLNFVIEGERTKVQVSHRREPSVPSSGIRRILDRWTVEVQVIIVRTWIARTTEVVISTLGWRAIRFSKGSHGDLSV